MNLKVVGFSGMAILGIFVKFQGVRSHLPIDQGRHLLQRGLFFRVFQGLLQMRKIYGPFRKFRAQQSVLHQGV